MAKDDNLDAADPNKEKKTEDKDQQMDTEEKEKINEQGDQVTRITPEPFSFGEVLLFNLHTSLLIGFSSYPDITHFILIRYASRYKTLCPQMTLLSNLHN